MCICLIVIFLEQWCYVWRRDEEETKLRSSCSVSKHLSEWCMGVAMFQGMLLFWQLCIEHYVKNKNKIKNQKDYFLSWLCCSGNCSCSGYYVLLSIASYILTWRAYCELWCKMCWWNWDDFRCSLRFSLSEEHRRGPPIHVCRVFQPEVVLPSTGGLTNYSFAL